LFVVSLPTHKISGDPRADHDTRTISCRRIVVLADDLITRWLAITPAARSSAWSAAVKKASAAGMPTPA
jgi:hypothetical protein